MACKTYCWSLGTTSFRTKNFIYSIERQLQLLDEFWTINPNIIWDRKTGQPSYYEFLKSNNFVSGDAARKDKDARQKTSGLVDIGLLDKKTRHLTDVGKKILNISKENNFSKNNILNIPNDSYVYLLQFLKFQFIKDEFKIKPFIALLYILEKNDFLTIDELTYLLPLCKTKENVYELSKLLKYNRTDIVYDEYIVEKIMSMDNYKEMYQKLLDTKDVNVTLFEEIGLNRDGGRHDRPYYELYISLHKLYLENNKSFDSRKQEYINLWEKVKKLSNTVSSKWKKYLFFGMRNINAIDEEFDDMFKSLDINNSINEDEFKKIFFERMHLYKCKATLEDYYDLNKRYLSLCEILKFSEYSTISLELIPKHFFEDVIDDLLSEELIEDIDIYNKRMQNYIPIEQISDKFIISQDELLKTINHKLGTKLDINQLKHYIEDEKNKEFRKLINDKFSNEYLINILSKIESRDDKYVMNEITNNADLPTIFEYILGISWYKISNCHGNLLDYIHLSLDNNLLPKTHAGGGIADIEYKYLKNETYDNHTLLIEATLSDSTTQRSMEMEPVSRHLGECIRNSNNFNDYAVFVAPRLDERLILDFRNMKTRKYPFTENHSVKDLEIIENDKSKYINGLKIIPVTIGIIKKCLKNKIMYDEIFMLFDNAYKSKCDDETWYNEFIVKKFLEIKE